MRKAIFIVGALSATAITAAVVLSGRAKDRFEESLEGAKDIDSQSKSGGAVVSADPSSMMTQAKSVANGLHSIPSSYMSYVPGASQMVDIARKSVYESLKRAYSAWSKSQRQSLVPAYQLLTKTDIFTDMNNKLSKEQALDLTNLLLA